MISPVIYADHLACPECHGEHLRHDQVTMYDRAEDAPRVTKTEVQDRKTKIITIANDGSGNPSERRDGLAVQFWCENCETGSELTIAQHKGVSLGWRILREGANGHPR
jgi:hypothetical protein